MSTTTTAPQIIWQQIGFWTKAELGAKQAVAVDENTLRFKTTNLGGIVVFVELDRAADLYNVRASRLRNGAEVVKLEWTGIFADHLNSMLVDLAPRFAH